MAETAPEKSRSLGEICAEAIKPLVGEERIIWGMAGLASDTPKLPDHSAETIELKCFELLPYALAHQGLMSKEKLFEGVRRRTSSKLDGSSAWAGFLGDLHRSEVPVQDLGDLRLLAGDIVVIHGRYHGGIHTVIATGRDSSEGAPLVYSLADRPSLSPLEMSLPALVELFVDEFPSHVQVFTPKKDLLE